MALEDAMMLEAFKMAERAVKAQEAQAANLEKLVHTMNSVGPALHEAAHCLRDTAMTLRDTAQALNSAVKRN